MSTDSNDAQTIESSVGMDKPDDDKRSDENTLTHDDDDGGGVRKTLMGLNQFDIVSDYSDHYYRDHGICHQCFRPREWRKRIQEEWKILQANLPETIFVRVYETRMDLMRVAIIGPDGTPYHDGLFFFDTRFPSRYPDYPPMVYYRSGGLQLNPNLYKNGYICLSLLGTWIGKQNEQWIPNESTMLQVLVSIQGLILNEKPFFNEVGHTSIFKGVVGRWISESYNEDVLLLSLKTMVYSLRHPPKNFECLVRRHFRGRADDIMTACRAYKRGAKVGSDFRKMVKEGHQVKNKNSKKFKSSLDIIVRKLIYALSENGSLGCEKFWIE